MAVNKVEFGDETLIDLTEDTVTPEALLEGAIAHDASGELIYGMVPPMSVDSALSLTSTNPVQNKVVNAAIDTKLSTTLKGTAGGLAELDENGKVPASQLPSYVDDVIEGYYYENYFYEDAEHTLMIVGEAGKIYIDLITNKTYRWSGSIYSVISETLALGETSSTAYRGDRGKTDYEHSQSAHAPADAQKNVQSDWNATSGDAYIKNKPTEFPPSNHNHTKSDISDFPSSLPASGGFAEYADKVWTQSHNGSWYINSNWDGTYFQTNCKSIDDGTLPINVARANSAGSAGSADWSIVMRGSYTGSGGQQKPNYFGTNKVGALMMNTTINGDNNYKDFLIMDCYDGNDVGGATAIGVDRQEMRAFIMGSDASRTSWTRSAELATVGHNHVISNIDGLQNALDSKLDKFTSGGIASCGGNGQYIYFKIATIKITSYYINRPIVFEMSGRGRELSLVTIEFSNSSNTDPGLNTFISNGDDCFWIKKADTSTWEVYGRYSESWGDFVIHRITGAGANIGVTVEMTNINSLPDGCTQVIYGGNVRYASIAGSISTDAIVFEQVSVNPSNGVDIVAPSKSGYTFKCWIGVASINFVGSPYILNPLNSITEIYDNNIPNIMNNTYKYRATALYVKSS